METASKWRRLAQRTDLNLKLRRCVCRLCALLLGAAVLACDCAVRGQDSEGSTNALTLAPSYQAVSSNEPMPLLAPGISRFAGTSQLALPAAVPLPALQPLLQWGALSLQSHLLYRLSYGDGLQPQPGHQTKTAINELDPGLMFQWGHWTLDYTSMLRLYSSRDFRDSFNNAVTLTGGTTYEDWAFGLSQSYLSSSDPLIETASQLDHQTYSTALSAICQLSSKASLELGANQNFRFLDNTVPGEQLSDSRSWSTMDWLNFQFRSGLGGAVGAGFGYDNVAVGSDMTSEQLQGRITWHVVNKASLVLSGGGEARQFLRSGASDLISSIFSLSARYSPFEVTTFSVTAFRDFSPSFYQDQVTESTSISVGLHQRILGKLFLDLNGGFANTTYHASTLAPVATNIDNYDSTFFGARLATSVLKRGSAAIFYSVNYNSSAAAIYNYTTTQFGLELSYRY